MKRKLWTGVLACGLAGLILSGCAEPKPKPDTREKAKRSHDELEQEEEQMKERKKEGSRDHSRLEEAAPPRGEVASLVPARPQDAEAVPEAARKADPAAPAAPKPTMAEPCRWVEAEGVVGMSDQDTLYQAKGRAIAAARQEAIKNVLGYEIRSRDAVFQQESLRGEQTLVESLIVSTQYGLILDEEILAAGPLRDGAKYRARVRTCIARQPERMDKGFRVTLGLNRQTFVEGDEAVVDMTVTRDSCVYLLNVDTMGNMSLVFPNSVASGNCAVAGKFIQYPDASLQRKGVHLTAVLPQGTRTSTETLKIIAFKTKMDHLFSDSPPAVASTINVSFERREQHNTGAYGDLVRKLVLDDVEWVEDSAAFVIHAK
ncbi:MAG: DUF4384 domain-containing protein [Nitrospirae bacterium]|nr:DUF4384 domain-containing protein [Nitrospirota bacterium]